MGLDRVCDLGPFFCCALIGAKGKDGALARASQFLLASQYARREEIHICPSTPLRALDSRYISSIAESLINGALARASQFLLASRVPSEGFEPPNRASKARVLSIRLRGQI